VSGLLLAAGGGMHPEAQTSGSVSRELAEMTADPLWVTGHAVIVVSTVLLAAALWGLYGPARRYRLPARTTRALRIAAVAVSLYVVETVVHTAATVDSDTLAEGGFAPVASAHIA
jgi:hypothetical protein